MINSLKMIFFDIDGTLLDHKGSEQEGIKKFYFLNEFNEKCDFDNFIKIWIKYSDKNFEKFLNKEYNFEQQRAMRIIDVYNKFGKEISYNEALTKFTDYLNAYESSWKAYDDVIPCLNMLNQYKLGIISNGDHKQQVEKLRKMNILEYFCDVVVAGDVGYAKPDNRIFEIACQRNNVNIENVFYVGDNIKTDVIPANEIGMKGILIDRDKERKTENNINRIFSLTDIKNLLKNQIL